MEEKINKYINDITNISNSNELDVESIKDRYLGKKGILSQLLSEFKTLTNEQKKKNGKLLNKFKMLVNDKLKINDSNKKINKKEIK